MLIGALLTASCGAESREKLATRTDIETSSEPIGFQQIASLAGSENLSIAVRQLPRSLDPLGDLEPWAARAADDLVFEGLTRRSEKGAPWGEPALADRCVVDIEHGGRAVNCHIPRERYFHDGQEVEVADVVYSLEFWLDRRRASLRHRHGLGGLKSIEVVDGPREDRDQGRWVRVGFSRAEPLILELIAAMKIVPRRRRRGRENEFRTSPVGTGPMRVTTLSSERWIFERVDDWLRPERSAIALAGLELRQVNDGAQGLTLARRGEVHILDRVAQTHIPVELGKPAMHARFEAWLVSPPRFDCLLYNMANGLQAGPRLRRALDAAIPRAALERDVYAAPGLTVRAPVDLHDPAPIDLKTLIDARSDDQGRAGLPNWLDPIDDEHGRIGAALTLDTLGWKLEREVRRKPGGNLRLALMWDGRTGRAERVSKAIRGQWRALGIQTPEATATWNYLMTLMGRGEFDIAMMRMTQHTDADLYPYFHSRGELNLAGVADGELDRALESYRTAVGQAERRAAKEDVAERLSKLQVASVLYAPAHVMLVARRVRGLEFEDDLPRLDKLGLEAYRPNAWQ